LATLSIQRGITYEDQHVSKDRGMTNGIFGLLVVNVTAHNAVEITPADNETEDNSSFVNALDVVAGPRDCISNTRVDAYSR
jgi:hypothetical protein